MVPNSINAFSTPGSVENYVEDCVFHGILIKGKALHEIIDFLNVGHEVVVFFASKSGLTMKADNRPMSAIGKSNVKETIFTDLTIPTNAFMDWHYDGDEREPESEINGTPIPVNVALLKSSIGTIMAKDMIVLFIMKKEIDSLGFRVIESGQGQSKMCGSTKLLDVSKLPAEMLKPLKAPYYDMDKPIVTFKAKALGDACKAAKSSKVNDLMITVYRRGIVISFGDNAGKKAYPHGTISGAEKLYTAKFEVPKRFESLLRCAKLNANVTVYATRGKPCLFSWGVKDTTGRMNVYMVPTTEHSE